MRALAICVVLVCGAGCSTLREPRLIGTWQSDRDATIEILTRYRELTPEQLEKVGAIFGKLTITYDKRNAHAKLDDWEHASRYRVLARNETCVILESPDLIREGKKSFKIIRFQGDNQYVLLSQLLNFPEVFKRIK